MQPPQSCGPPASALQGRCASSPSAQLEGPRVDTGKQNVHGWREKWRVWKTRSLEEPSCSREAH